MEILIVIFVILSLIGSISFLKPSKKMKALTAIRHIASKEGFKIGSTQILRKKFKSWTPQVAIYQIKNGVLFTNFLKSDRVKFLTILCMPLTGGIHGVFACMAVQLLPAVRPG
mgnify:CR=1 FL=1